MTPDEGATPPLPRRADLRGRRGRATRLRREQREIEVGATDADQAPTDADEPSDWSYEEQPDPADLFTRVERQQFRRQRRWAAVAGALAGLAILSGIVSSGVLDRSRVVPDAAPVPPPQAVVEPDQATLLLARSDADGGAATGAVLMAVDPDGTAFATFVPVSLLADIPGHGNGVELGNALRDGGPALLGATVSNLFGIELDATAVASGSALAALLERTGGLEIDVERRLTVREPDGRAVVRFEPGAQTLDGERLAEYLRFRESGETEVATFVRQQGVVLALIEALGDPAVLDAVLADGAPQLDVAGDRDAVREVLQGLGTAASREAVRMVSLPVQPVGGANDGGPAYVLPPGGADAFADAHLSGSRSIGTAGATRVEVLNGVGRPGIGSDVAALLTDGGFRIERTENAARFDQERTLVVVYDESPESLQAAEAVRSRLGVGTIQVSRQPQSVVDLTIVVGADFQAGAASTPGPEPEQGI